MRQAERTDSLTGNTRVDQVVELLCSHGCRAVTLYIQRLEQGEEDTHWAHLDAGERRILLRELTAIMAVYGGKCRVEP